MKLEEFRAAVARAHITYRALAIELGLSEQALHNKVKGLTEFKSSEIKKAAELLKLSMEEVNDIFFDSMVN